MFVCGGVGWQLHCIASVSHSVLQILYGPQAGDGNSVTDSDSSRCINERAAGLAGFVNGMPSPVSGTVRRSLPKKQFGCDFPCLFVRQNNARSLSVQCILCGNAAHYLWGIGQLMTILPVCIISWDREFWNS